MFEFSEDRWDVAADGISGRRSSIFGVKELCGMGIESGEIYRGWKQGRGENGKQTAFLRRRGESESVSERYRKNK